MIPLLAKSAASRARKVQVEHVRFEKEMREYLLSELKALREAVPVDDLAKVLHAAKEAEIFEVIDASELKGVFTGLNDMLVHGAAAGAKAAASEIGRVAVLDATRPRIKKWLHEHAAELVTQLNATSKDAVRTIVSAGVEMGRHPKRLAQDVKNVIGLTDRDAGAVVKRRGWLEQQVNKGELSPARANELGDQYGDQLLTARAENIARTESLAAVNHGRAAVIKQLVDDGALPEAAQQEWDAAHDRAVCPICSAMHKKRIPIGEDWELPDGRMVAAPPAHPGCRCTVLAPVSGYRD